MKTFGPGSEVTLDLIAVDLARMREMFITGVAEWSGVSVHFSEATLLELQRIAALQPAPSAIRRICGQGPCSSLQLRITSQVISRDHTVQALVPLYRREKLRSFLLENQDASADDVEKNVESL